MRADIVKLRSLLSDGAAFGINVFAPPGHGVGAAEVVAYAETLSGEAERSGTALGEPRWDDDSYAEKLELLCAERVAGGLVRVRVPRCARMSSAFTARARRSG